MNKNIFKYLIIALLQVLIIMVAFSAGYLSYRYVNEQDFKFPVLLQVYNLVQENAIDSLPSMQDVEHGMIRGMLQVINNPYNALYEAPQQQLQTNQLEGKFGGVGMRLEIINGDNSIALYPFPDSPAKKAGIEDGDILIAVDGLTVTKEVPMDTIQAAVRGPAGSTVKITVRRMPSNNQVTFSIKRIEVPLPSVTWNVIPQNHLVGIIHIGIIASTTTDEIRKAMDDLNSKGVKNLILDLRNNSGGLVDSGINTAKLFLKGGTIMQQRYRNRQDETYQVGQPGLYSDIPMVVLINHGTASSAEIIAGAIKGQKRALLIGSPTYGKNSIQIIYNLADNSSLHLTVAKWWIPGLTQIDNKGGIQPDIVIKDEDTNQPAMIDTALTNLFKQ